jgi:hypothetical protein
MKLMAHEIDLVGGFLIEDNKVSADAVEARIRSLIETHLQKVATNPESGAWEVLYQDPSDGRYWEKTHPMSEMHGGGPMRLTCIDAPTANKKYGLKS